MILSFQWGKTKTNDLWKFMKFEEERNSVKKVIVAEDVCVKTKSKCFMGSHFDRMPVGVNNETS